MQKHQKIINVQVCIVTTYNTEYYYDSNEDGTKEQNNTYWPCGKSNWLDNKAYQWTISIISENINNVWYVSSIGNFNYGISDSSISVRPVFYLKSNINMNGSGTKTDPYRVSK